VQFCWSKRFLEGGFMSGSNEDREATESNLNLDQSFGSRLELRQLLATAAGTQEDHPRKGKISSDPQAYDEIFRKLTRRTGDMQKRLTLERKAAGDQWAILESHPQARRRLMIRNDRRFQSWGLYQCLLERFRDLMEHRPGEAAEAAELALEIAGSLDPAEHGRGRIADFQVGALAALGEARRRLSDLEGAREALLQARERLEEGTGDLLEEAELEHLRGRLHQDLGEPEAAERAFRRAGALYRRIGDPRLQTAGNDPGQGRHAHPRRAGGRRAR
jgi:tetratricopeptide (TPR) repeat protein